MNKLQPTNGYIQVEMIEEENVTSSGIILNNNDEDKIEQGVVVHAGDSGLEIGTGVLFKNYVVDAIKIGQKKLYFVKTSEVIAMYVPSV